MLIDGENRERCNVGGIINTTIVWVWRLKRRATKSRFVLGPLRDGGDMENRTEKNGPIT